jgi:small subunit ribosomal protein S9
MPTSAQPITKKSSKTTTKKESMHSLFSGKYNYANGKRKSAIARVRIYEKGKGDIIVNGKPYKEYFSPGTYFGIITSPLKLTQVKEYSITAKITGGGVSAQADALRHGIAKALTLLNIEHRSLLKHDGQLTRDARIVERKKPGRRKARRGHQWVKR